MVETARQKVTAKSDPTALSPIRLESFDEESCAQTLHIGPFDQEGPTIERVYSFILECGGRLRDKHHEIYLSDIRRTAPENLKNRNSSAYGFASSCSRTAAHRDGSPYLLAVGRRLRQSANWG